MVFRSLAALAFALMPALSPGTAAGVQLASFEFAAPWTSSVSLQNKISPALSAMLLSNQDADAATYAEVDEETARKLVRGCTVPHEVNSPPGSPGDKIVLQMTVDARGKLLTVHRMQGPFTRQLSAGFASCHFAMYKLNGTATGFRSTITIDVK